MTISFEEVAVGQAVPAFKRDTDLMNWNRYAAVNDELVYGHMDDEAAIAVGEKAVFGMGNLRLAYLHCMLRTWLGDEGMIRGLSVQHRAVNYKNDTLTARGTVTAKRVENGERLIDLDLTVENQKGEYTDVGKATVALGGAQEITNPSNRTGEP